MKNYLIALCFLYGVVAKAQPPIQWHAEFKHQVQLLIDVKTV